MTAGTRAETGRNCCSPFPHGTRRLPVSAQQDYRLDDRYRADEGTVFLTGIQALARLPFEQLRADRAAGLRTAAFISGYQGSPLGGYGDAIEAAARVEKDLPVVFRQAMNEEYAATAVMGSQLASARPDVRYDGIVGIWYGKAPGVDRASDALRHANFAGTSMNGGAVAIVGDDPMPSRRRFHPRRPACFRSCICRSSTRETLLRRSTSGDMQSPCHGRRACGLR